MSTFGIWGHTNWNQSLWFHQPGQPGAGWGNDWRWWFQTGSAVIDLAGMIIEARWTTDAFHLADGSYRGDLQPGKLTMRLWDPDRVLDNIDELGVFFARYQPAGYMWVWFFESVTRGLYAPDDPQAADVVITATTWPPRLMSPTTDFNRPQESVATRLAAVVSAINGKSQLHIPTLATNIAAQSQLVGATATDSGGFYPSYLQAVRDAAVFGIAWIAACVGATIGSTGQLTFIYRRWEAGARRPLDPGQVVAGPAVTRGIDQVVTQVQMQPLDNTVPGGGNLNPVYGSSSSANIYGVITAGPMRVWDLVNGFGPNYQAIIITANSIVATRMNMDKALLSTVSCQSGPRWTPDGRPSSSSWDPAAHVATPDDVLDWTDQASGKVYEYRVASSDHVLSAAAWSTTHTLELLAPPNPLP